MHQIRGEDDKQTVDSFSSGGIDQFLWKPRRVIGQIPCIPKEASPRDGHGGLPEQEDMDDKATSNPVIVMVDEGKGIRHMRLVERKVLRRR